MNCIKQQMAVEEATELVFNLLKTSSLIKKYLVLVLIYKESLRSLEGFIHFVLEMNIWQCPNPS